MFQPTAILKRLWGGEMNKDNLKRYLLNATSCKMQHDGWTCGIKIIMVINNV